MGNWRYLAQRLDGTGGTTELLDVDLPLEDVVLTDALSGPSELQATIDPAFSRLMVGGRPLLENWGTAIWAEEDRNIIGGGILVDSGWVGPKWSLDVAGYVSYARDMPYIGSWSGVEIDYLDVVRQIWSHLQSQEGGNLGLQLGSEMTGKLIGTELEQIEFDTQSGPISFESGPIKLNYWQTHDLAAEMDKLAQDAPFEYHERHQWEGDEIKHYLDFGVPRLGRRHDKLRFVLGENIFVSPAINGSGDDYASEILALGAGQGRTIQMAQLKRPTNRLRRVAKVEDKSARSKRAIQVVAEVEMAWRKSLETVSEIALIDHPHAPMGAVRPGDEIYIEGQTDWIELRHWVRVLSVVMRPADGNAVTLVVAPADRLSG